MAFGFGQNYIATMSSEKRSYADKVSERRLTYWSKFQVENEDDAMAIAVRNSISDLNKVLHLNLAIQFYLFPF